MLFLVISCILILLSLALSSIIVFILFKILCYFLLFLISYIINLDLKKYRLQLFLIDHERIVYKYFNYQKIETKYFFPQSKRHSVCNHY